MATKVRVTEEGLLIPKEVTDRALGEGLEEVETLEEDGRLVVAAAGPSRLFRTNRAPIPSSFSVWSGPTYRY